MVLIRKKRTDEPFDAMKSKYLALLLLTSEALIAITPESERLAFCEVAGAAAI